MSDKDGRLEGISKDSTSSTTGTSLIVSVACEYKLDGLPRCLKLVPIECECVFIFLKCVFPSIDGEDDGWNANASTLQLVISRREDKLSNDNLMITIYICSILQCYFGKKGTLICRKRRI
mmetsp:Transcript_11647/g.17013  ORF Transcript_11647/g.17013 Transcript_11647/m.17013 type:complete len:120 (+) Transcript_11647:831-1190(+)